MRFEAGIIALCSLVFLYASLTSAEVPPNMRTAAAATGCVALLVSVVIAVVGGRIDRARKEFAKFFARAQQPTEFSRHEW